MPESKASFRKSPVITGDRAKSLCSARDPLIHRGKKPGSPLVELTVCVGQQTHKSLSGVIDPCVCVPCGIGGENHAMDT